MCARYSNRRGEDTTEGFILYVWYILGRRAASQLENGQILIFVSAQTLSSKSEFSYPALTGFFHLKVNVKSEVFRAVHFLGAMAHILCQTAPDLNLNCSLLPFVSLQLTGSVGHLSVCIALCHGTTPIIGVVHCLIESVTYFAIKGQGAYGLHAKDLYDISSKNIRRLKASTMPSSGFVNCCSFATSSGPTSLPLSPPFFSCFFGGGRGRYVPSICKRSVHIRIHP